MIYENRDTLMYKVIGSVIYTIIDEYICLDYLGLLQEKLSKHDDKSKNAKFNNLSGLGIPDILVNIMSGHGFVKSSISTFILTCRNALFPYYLSKGFFITETEVGGVDNIPIIVKKINATHLHEEESLLTYKAAINSTVNTLNKITIVIYVYEKYLSNYYDDRHVESYNLKFFCFVKQRLD